MSSLTGRGDRFPARVTDWVSRDGSLWKESVRTWKAPSLCRFPPNLIGALKHLGVVTVVHVGWHLISRCCREHTPYSWCVSDLGSAATPWDGQETPLPRGAPRSGGWLHRRLTPEYVPESGRRPVIQVPAWKSRGAHQERRGPRMQEQHVGQSEPGETRQESWVLWKVLRNPCCSEETSAEPGCAPPLLLQGQWAFSGPQRGPVSPVGAPFTRGRILMLEVGIHTGLTKTRFLSTVCVLVGLMQQETYMGKISLLTLEKWDIMM